MKVLHVIDSGGLYGAENVLLNCVEEQRRQGHEPTIASIGVQKDGDKPLEVEASRQGYAIIRFRMRRGINILGAYNIVKYAKKNGIDIIHSHGYKGNVLLGLMPRCLRQIPIITTLHGWTGINRSGRLALYQWLDKQSLRFMDAVVVVTESMLKLKPVRNLKRVFVIYNGIKFSGIEARREYNHEWKIIGAAGRLSPEKGFSYLIDAFALNRTAGLEAKLVIVGEGPERGALQQRITTLGLDNHAELPGYRGNMDQFYRELDVFVISSLTEGSPMCVLESMRAKTPIVATRVGGIPELLDHGKAGKLVTARNVQELADAIRKTCDDTLGTQGQIDYAYQRASKLYDSTTMSKSYNDVYTRVLAASERMKKINIK